MKYFFCAVFEWKGNEYAVKFPDFPDLYTHGETLEDAFEMAQEVLEGYLVLLELQEKEIPSPTPVQELNARIKRSENVNLFVVKANTKVAKARNKQNYDRKSVTVEHYLEELIDIFQIVERANNMGIMFFDRISLKMDLTELGRSRPSSIGG